MPIEHQSPRSFSFVTRFFSELFSVFKPKRTDAIEAPARFAMDPARTAPFDPQVARRMAQLESELTRLAESQYAAREERLRLSEEVAHLRQAARQSVGTIPLPPGPPNEAETLVVEMTTEQ